MEDLLPNPTDLIGGLAYIDQEAAAGHFEQRSDLDVFRHLWIHCWHTDRYRGKPVDVGLVLESKVRVEDICAATMLKARAVTESLSRLSVGGWISREQTRFVSDTGRGWKSTNEIYVLMDPTSHRERAKNRDVTSGFEALLADGERVRTILDTH